MDARIEDAGSWNTKTGTGRVFSKFAAGTVSTLQFYYCRVKPTKIADLVLSGAAYLEVAPNFSLTAIVLGGPAASMTVLTAIECVLPVVRLFEETILEVAENMGMEVPDYPTCKAVVDGISIHRLSVFIPAALYQQGTASFTVQVYQA